jgi:transcriptional regulator with XRE-family HTH domain
VGLINKVLLISGHMTNIQRVLGYNLRKLRVSRGLTQAALAEKAGTVGNYIALIESAAKFPSADMIERISAALGVDSIELFSPIKDAFTNPWNWSETSAKA